MLFYLGAAALAAYILIKKKAIPTPTLPGAKAVFSTNAPSPTSYAASTPLPGMANAGGYASSGPLSPFTTPKQRATIVPLSDSPIAPVATDCSAVFATLSPEMQQSIAGLSKMQSKAAVISILAAQAEADGNPQAAACIRALA